MKDCKFVLPKVYLLPEICLGKGKYRPWTKTNYFEYILRGFYKDNYESR